MAKVVDDLIVQGLSGRLGKQVVVRRRRDGTYVAAAAPQTIRRLATGRTASSHRAANP